MKRLPLAALLAVLLLPAASHAGKFTYHGELMDGDTPAEGTYDLRVRSFARQGDAKALGEPTELPAVLLSEGRFSVELEIPEVPDGITWVEVAIRRAGSGDAYETLGDPQPIAKANSTCPGAWALDGNSGMPAGSFLGTVDTNAVLDLRASNRRVARYDSTQSPGYIDAPRLTLGSTANQATAEGASTLGGGATHDGDTSHPDPSVTNRNLASASFATTVGGIGNTASGHASVAAGSRSSASGFGSVAIGNAGNASNSSSAVLGGVSNTASGQSSVVTGGDYNTAAGTSSMVGAGRSNCAGGDGSWVGGFAARTRSGNEPDDGNCGSTNSGDADGDEGSFVWAGRRVDGSSLLVPFVSTGPNQFLVRADGGVAINTNTISNTLDLVIAARSAASGADADADLGLESRGGKRASMYVSDGSGMLVLTAPTNTGDTRFGLGIGSPVSGRYLVTNANAAHLTTGGTWTNGSSRAFKHAFEAIDVSDVLARVVALPLSRWQYRDSSEGSHIGPMAEDFSSAFGLGGSAQHISTVDADGVALAAIQGLNAKLEAENAALRQTLEALAARLERLESRHAGE